MATTNNDDLVDIKKEILSNEDCLQARILAFRLSDIETLSVNKVSLGEG